jgi:ATP/maltotriose-dependent transcriptional regulator MalT
MFLQRLEDAISGRQLPYHLVNGQVLRARLALQTGQVDQALVLLPSELRVDVIPSMQGEYLATRAIALSLMGQYDEAHAFAKEAQRITSAVEVLGLATIALSAPFSDRASVRALWELCRQLGTWDALLLGLRASHDLAGALAAEQDLRSALSELYARTNDRGLARRARLRFRDTRRPEHLLTPRELEVLGLLAQGLRNQDISRALVISDSTTKVHIRHILEKLGVRTRAEAVARLGVIG